MVVEVAQITRGPRVMVEDYKDWIAMARVAPSWLEELVYNLEAVRWRRRRLLWRRRRRPKCWRRCGSGYGTAFEIGVRSGDGQVQITGYPRDVPVIMT